MKQLNTRLIVGIIINTIIALIIQLSGEYDILCEVMWGVITVNLIGILLILLNTPRIGAWTIMISSICVFPIGAIGLFGGIQLLNELEQEAIDRD